MNKELGKILIVDDDEMILLSLKILLEQYFSSIQTLNNPERIPALMEKENIEVVLLDMNFRQGDTTCNEGLFWLRKILNSFSPVQVILMTAYAEVPVAVEAIKDGALDFIVKPWQNEKLVTTVKAALSLNKEKRKVLQLRSQQRILSSTISSQYETVVGISPLIQDIKRTIDKVAKTDAEILILGGNGTGKEVIAREIHRQSHRADNVFISVDVGALSETIFESELFGHRKGAFTDAKEDRMGRFEAADGGTLFLDEIGNLSLSLQAKLLTALQNKKITRLGANDAIEVNVRIICATNSNLRDMVKEGKFREDLFYRINTVEITIPSLLDRPEDIPLLAQYFLKKFSAKYLKHQVKLSDEVASLLTQYRWPGNVRELQHAVERAVIMSEGIELKAEDFGIHQKEISIDAVFDHLNLEKLEEWAIRKVIAKHGGNISYAARELGLSRGALYRRMEYYGI